jgi:hypothetical protein
METFEDWFNALPPQEKLMLISDRWVGFEKAFYAGANCATNQMIEIVNRCAVEENMEIKTYEFK